MDEDQKAEALIQSGVQISKAGALRFVELWEAMKRIDRAEAEEERVAHARAMSQPRRL